MTMTTDEITETLRVASLTHLLAVDAARTTLASLPKDDPRRLVLKLELSNAYGRMGLARGSYGKLVTEPREYQASKLNLQTVDQVTGEWRNRTPDEIRGLVDADRYEATLADVATEMAVEETGPLRRGFTVEETDTILANHYPWALPQNNR